MNQRTQNMGRIEIRESSITQIASMILPHVAENATDDDRRVRAVDHAYDLAEAFQDAAEGRLESARRRDQLSLNT